MHIKQSKIHVYTIPMHCRIWVPEKYGLHIIVIIDSISQSGTVLANYEDRNLLYFVNILSSNRKSLWMILAIHFY